jgi:precorrin-6B methylase 2
MKNYTKLIANRLKYWRNRLKRSKKYLQTHQILHTLQNNNLKNITLTEQERKNFTNYFSHHLATGMTLSLASEYRFRQVKLSKDKKNNLHYITTDNGYRLYFGRNTSKAHIKEMYNNLCMEQDHRSPHNYCFDNLQITPDTILADIGASEGFFTLQFIDKIKKAYLFESDPEWIEALQATFQPWKDKTVIINKYISNTDNNNNITLDKYFHLKPKPTIIKLDIEGSEQKALEGAAGLLHNSAISDILVATYHRREDAETLPQLLKNNNYTVKLSPGYMLLTHQTGFVPDAPFEFRKGICHAKQNKQPKTPPINNK